MMENFLHSDKTILKKTYGCLSYASGRVRDSPTEELDLTALSYFSIASLLNCILHRVCYITGFNLYSSGSCTKLCFVTANGVGINVTGNKI